MNLQERAMPNAFAGKRGRQRLRSVLSQRLLLANLLRQPPVYRIGEDQSGGNRTILQPVIRCAFSPMSGSGQSRRSAMYKLMSAYPPTPDLFTALPRTVETGQEATGQAAFRART